MDLTALWGGALAILFLFAAGARPASALRLTRRIHLFNPVRSRALLGLILAAVIAPFVYTVGQVAVNGYPSATVHDEFSYLLTADTLLEGRLANPSHPMRKFFESFHILQMPTYASKYPTASAAAMAAGQFLLGHPWWGVFVSVAAMCAALYWALLGWMPRRWALLGCVLAAVYYGANHYWITSYWGGAVAGLGGALYFGAIGRTCYPRAGREPGWRTGVVLGVGLALMANTRPWEGLLVAVPGAVLMTWRLAGGLPKLRFRPQLLLAVVVVLVLAGGFMAELNRSVTGDWARMPYAEYATQYDPESLFLFGSVPATTIAYNHEVFRLYYAGIETYQTVHHGDGTVDWGLVLSRRLLVFFLFFGAGLTGIATLVVAPMVWKSPKQRFALLSMVFFFVGFCLQRYHHLHYLAPLLALALYMKVSVIRNVLHLGSRRWPPAVAFACALVALEIGYGIVKAGEPYETWWDTDRDRVARLFNGEPGGDLAIVRYTAGHDPRQEWVYNAADIDASDIVWAREMSPGETCELLDYFSDRKAWLVLPNIRPDRPTPYELDCPALGSDSNLARGGNP